MSKFAFAMENVDLTYRIRKRFRISRTRHVFRNLNLSVRPGDKIGITGRNGAGKSSLLMLLAGTLAPNGGRIINNCKHTALLTLNFGIEPTLPGRMNAVLHALYLGYTRNEIRNKIDRIIEFSGLKEVIDDPYYTYSSGMRARLSFSVAYHLDADLLLIDEMLGVGDAEFKRKSREALQNKMHDLTAVIVSHSVPTLRQLCGRCYELKPHGLQEM